MKWIYRIIGIVTLCLVIWFVVTITSLSKAFDGFSFKHELNSKNFEFIKSSLSTDSTKVYYHYMFDQGGYGYSRTFWAVVGKEDKNLEQGILPDGYRVIGWTKDDELLIEKFDTNDYMKEAHKLQSGTIFNGVKLLIE